MTESAADWLGTLPETERGFLLKLVEVFDATLVGGPHDVDPPVGSSVPKAPSAVLVHGSGSPMPPEAGGDLDTPGVLPIRTDPGWERPIPLEAPPPPGFPTEVLPAGLREMVDAVSVAYQVPSALPALLALGCVSAAVAGRARVRVGPDWTEELCAYVAVVLPSGERKSPVVREMAAPLESWEEAALESELDRLLLVEEERRIAEQRLGNARNRAAREAGEERAAAEKEVYELAVELARLEQPIVSRLLADDATPEALVSLLADHGGRIAVISAEGGLFDILAGRYTSGAANLDAVLKAYSCEPIRVDRKGRRPERIPRPALALGFAIQPVVLETITSRAELRGRGLLARFWYSVPRTALGRRELDPPPVPAEARLAYELSLIDLLGSAVESAQSAQSGRAADYTDTANSAAADDRPELRLADGARRLLWDFRAQLEPRLDPESGDLFGASDWAGKLPGSCVRIAGMLHLYSSGWESGIETPVPEETMAAALTIGEYLIPHALIALGLTGPRAAATAPAVAIVRWLRREHKTEFKATDVLDALSRSLLPDMARVESAIHLLESLNYIQKKPPPSKPRGPGRPPSPTYLVTPHLHTRLDNTSGRESHE